MNLYRWFYFVFFWGMSSIMPYFALHYEARGLSSMHLSILMAIPPLGTMLSSPVWAGIADKTQKHRQIMLLATAGSVIAGVGYIFSHSFWALLPFVALFSISLTPQMPIVDASLMVHLGDRKDEYGRQRLLGSVSVAISGLVVSMLITQFGLDASLFSFIIAAVAMWVLLSKVPLHIQPRTGNFGEQLGVLLRDRRLVAFLVIAMFGMMGYSTIMNYLFVRMEELGADNKLMGLALTIGTIGEIPFLFFSNTLVRKWGPRGVALLSLSAMTFMLFSFAFVTNANWILFLELFHGLCFSGMIIAGVTYMNSLAPKGLESTAQGVYGSIANGLAMAIGAFVGGLVRARYSNQAMFLAAGVIVLITLIVFALRPIQDTASA